MKYLKKILPVFLFVAIMGISTSVFAVVHVTKISVPKGSVRYTSTYDMAPGYKPRLYFNITKINGSSSKTAGNYTTMDIQVINNVGRKVINARRTYTSSWIGSDTKIDGEFVQNSDLRWYAKYDTSCGGTNTYPSFYSDYVAITQFK